AIARIAVVAVLIAAARGHVARVGGVGGFGRGSRVLELERDGRRGRGARVGVAALDASVPIRDHDARATIARPICAWNSRLGRGGVGFDVEESPLGSRTGQQRNREQITSRNERSLHGVPYCCWQRALYLRIRLSRSWR